MKNTVIGAFGARAIVDFARAAITAADEVKGVESRLRIASRSWKEYGEALAGVKQIAAETGTTVAINAAMLGRISEPLRAIGASQADALAMVRSVNDALFVSGASASESAAAMNQLSLAMESGALEGRRLMAVLNTTPRLAKAIADGLGVTVTELKALGEQGALTNEQIFNAMRSQQATLAGEAARIPATVGMAFTNLGEGIKQYIAGVDESTNATGNLAGALNTVAANIPGIVSGFQTLGILATAVFGARALASAAGYITTQRALVAANREAVAEAVARAKTELAVQQAILVRAKAEAQAIAAAQAGALANGQAAASLAARASAERLLAANQGVTTAGMALNAARSAQAAANVGLLGRAMSGAAVAGRGLLAMLGGLPGLAITAAITAAVLAWDHFTSKTKNAAKEAQIPVKELIKNFEEFASKAGPNELAEQIEIIRERYNELDHALESASFKRSKEGKQAAEDLVALGKLLEDNAKRQKKYNDERMVEKGLLGIDKLKIDAGGLIDADLQKNFEAFKTLYTDFVAKVTKDNGQLKVSALEARAALEKLFAQAKTPADFTGLINRIGDALHDSKNSVMKPTLDSTMQSTLENAIEARSMAERKALDSLVVGLEARAKRTQGLFTQAAEMALAQYSQAYALAKVAAELADDSRAVSRIDSGSRNAEVSVAVQASNLEINALEQVAARKRELVKESIAAAQATADGEIAAARNTMKARLDAFQKEVDAGKRTAGMLKDFKLAQEKDLAEKIAGPQAARVQAEADGARQLRQIDADTARERATIAENLYKTIQAKANDALGQYKTYASQVIALDKAIANNRLDTMAAIGDLQRKGMNPKQQLDSLREQLDAVRAATAEALAAGQKDAALDLLNRQKALVQQMAQMSGEGINEKKLREEGIAALEEIGAQAEAILHEQRAAAAESAAEQLKAYQDMVQAMNGLAQQITELNSKAAIQLKPEIDKASLDGAIEAVKTAFANTVIPIRVQVDGLPTAQPMPDNDFPGRAYGGPLPGWASHDRADNMLYRGTPGEWVIQRPAVRYWGPAFLAAINAMRLPKFAYGGQLGGGSIASRLRVPSVSPAAASAGSGDPVVLDLGALGRIRGRTSADTVSDVEEVIKRAAWRYGKH